MHLSVAIPPKISISNFMGYLKGKGTLMIYDRHPELQSKCDKAFWSRGYYIETLDNITNEAVLKYIKDKPKNQEEKILKVPLYSGPVRALEISLFWAKQ